MKLNWFAALCAACLITTLNAQDYLTNEPKSLPLLFLNEAVLSTGTVIEKIPLGGMREFQLLAPGSEILARDITQFSSDPGMLSFGNALSAQVGFSIRNKEKSGYHPGRTLRLGIHYFSQQRYSYFSSRSVTTPWDTLTSAQTGEQILIDSVHTQSYSFDYWVDHLRLDASMIFRTVRESRWSWFGGIGMTFGPSLQSESSVQSISTRTVRTGNIQANHFYDPDGDDVTIENENFTLKTVIGGSVYIPAGVDFRVGKKREFWKPVHIFYEIRPQVIFTSIPELDPSFRAGIQQGFGIRVKWR
jgi:hypothetical protein